MISQDKKTKYRNLFCTQLKCLVDNRYSSNWASFCRDVGITSSTIQSIRDGGGTSIDTIFRIYDKTKVSLSWLLTGEEENNSGEPNSEFVKIPRLDIEASAGGGRFNIGTAKELDYIPFTQAFFQRRLRRSAQPYPEHLKIITIKGDSMLPTIDDNDLAMIDFSDNSRTDGLYAFCDDDGVKVKRLRFTPQEIEVISDNKEIYPSYVYKKSELEQYYFEILGPIKWLGRSLTK